jgi:hypothetical protein
MKKWNNQRLSAAVIARSLMAITMCTVIPFEALAEDSCARDPNRSNMVVQLTRSGQQKLTRVAYEKMRRSMNDILKLIPPTTPEFGANQDLCKRENARKLSDKKYIESCFGLLPEALWDPNIPDASMQRLEPVVMRMENVSLKNVGLSRNPNLSCKNNVCEITASVDQLDLDFDISLRSVNETCIQAGLDDVHVSLNPKALKTKPTQVKFKFRLTNNISDPVKISWNESQFNVPVGAISYRAKSVTEGKNLCEKNQGIQKVADVVVGDLVAKNQIVINMILDNLKKQVIESLVDAEIVELARANGVGKDIYADMPVPALKDLMDAGALKAGTQEQLDQADAYLDIIMSSAGNPVVLSKKLSQNVPVAAIAEFRKSFRRGKAKDVSTKSEALQDKWLSVYRTIARKANETTDSNLKTVLDGELDKIRWTLKNLEEFQRDIQIEQVAKNPDDPVEVSQKVALILTALQANDLQSEIQAKVSACYRCQSLGVKATAGADWGFETGDHDLALKTGYGTINQFLALMHQNDGLDTCVIENAKRDCKDARPEDGIIDVHFPNAPELVWNPESNSFAFKVKQIQLTNHKGTLGKVASKIEADVLLPGRLAIDKVTNQLHFEPIAESIRVTNPYFKAADWDPTKVISGIVAWAGEKMANKAFAHNMMKKALTVDVDLPESSTISQVKANPQGFSVYMKLPDNPLDLLPPEKGDRTLATSKTKLK